MIYKFNIPDADGHLDYPIKNELAIQANTMEEAITKVFGNDWTVNCVEGY